MGAYLAYVTEKMRIFRDNNEAYKAYLNICLRTEYIPLAIK